MSLLSHLPDSSAGNPLGEHSDDHGTTERLPRTNLFLAASIAAPGLPPRDARIRNLSASGAKIDVANPPARGTTLLLRRSSVKAAAEVVWTAEGSCGLRFTELVDVGSWVSDRPAATPPVVTAEPTLADDLVLVRQLVERLEDELACQPLVVEAMGEELQSLDLAAHLLRLAERRACGSTAPGHRGVRQAAKIFLGRLAGS